jgi:hypothetical protein
MAAPTQHPSIQRSSILKYVYTHNPFYAISAVLMLYATQAAYAKLELAPSNWWFMTGVLAAYTLVLATIGVWIVRWGKVWEDARSILLLLLVLFLAVSISADGLFVKAEAASAATSLLLCGFSFSAVVSEGVLWGAGVNLGARYRIPYHLLLALFYIAPWWYSRGLHPRSEDSLDWQLVLFPVAAAALFLTLLPAVRGGARYVAGNGTPWPWPWFPGTAFGVIAAAVGLRSYALTMTFGLDGSIWRRIPGGREIVFDTIWGTYFLVPLALAILVLLLEGGLAAGNQRFTRRVVGAAPLVLFLAVPWGRGAVYQEFLWVFVRTVGSPFWITIWLLLAFYSWAWVRGVQGAGRDGLVAALLLSIVDSWTIDPHTLAEPRAWPFAVIAVLALVQGIRRRSSVICLAAGVLAVFGLWWWLPQTRLSEWQLPVCFHCSWLTALVLGLTFRDELAWWLRGAAAAMFPLATLLAITGGSSDLSQLLRLSYVVLLAGFCLIIGTRFRSFFYGFGAMLAVMMYAVGVIGFRRAVDAFGRAAVTAFVWSLGTLLVAFLISARKARWVPRRSEATRSRDEPG